MDTEKILQFLQQVMDKLGPMGAQAYNLVKVRVFAESLIWTVVGILALVVVLITEKKIWNLTAKKPEPERSSNYYHYSDDIMDVWFPRGIAGMFGSFFIIGFGSLVISSLIDLFSLDYATIARLISLAK